MSFSTTVLIVENDVEIRELMQLGLQAEGYRVLTAAHGQAALDVLGMEVIDLIMLDMRMPVMDGWTFARNYHRQAAPLVPIVVVTAAHDAAERAADIGAEGHLSKPFELHELLATVELALQPLFRPALDAGAPPAIAPDLNAAPVKGQPGRQRQVMQPTPDDGDESDPRVRTILERIPDGFVALDADWRVTYANPAALTLLRAQSLELLGRKLWEAYPELIGSEFGAAFRRSMADRVSVDIEAWHQTADAWFAMRIFPSSDGGLSAYFLDVTEERSAHERQARLAAIVESSNDAIIGKTLDGTITSWNPAAERLYGYQAEEVIGRSIVVLIPTDRPDETPALLERLRRGEHVSHYETERVHKDGRQLVVSLSLSPVHNWTGLIVGAAVIARDITDQRHANEARDRLVAIVESSSDAIIGKTIDGTIISWNAAAERLYGYSAAEAVGHTIALLAPLDHADETPALIARIWRGEHVTQHETERLHKDGQRLAVSLSLSLVQDSTGSIVGAEVTRDISGQRLRDAALQRYRLFAENTQDIVLFSTPEQRILECNAAAVAAYGYTRSELLDLMLGDLRALGSGAPVLEPKAQPDSIGVSFETVHVRKDGATFPVELSQVSTDIGGQRVLLSIARDITLRRAAEAVLHAAAAEMQAAQRIAHLGSWEMDLTFLSDLNRNSLHWSDECFRIFGYEPNEVEVTNEIFFARVHADDRAAVASALKTTILYGPSSSLEHRIVLRDGTERVVLQRDDVVRDANGRPSRLVGSVQDITERKHIEGELAELLATTQEARGEAETAVHVRDEFLSIAAHELKTPVTAIKLAAQLLSSRRRQLTEETPGVERMIATLEAGASRLARLTEDLLDVARLQTGHLKVRSEDLDLSTLVDLVVAPHRLRVGLAYHLEITGTHVPHRVMGDHDRLQQVFSNLLDNSIKYSPEGGTIRLSLQAESDGCLVDVEDEGIGLPVGSEDTIFQPFGRAANATASAIQGMGLGLYICRQIVASHGGRLWANSAGENRGTTVHVWLPCAPLGESIEEDGWDSAR